MDYGQQIRNQQAKFFANHSTDDYDPWTDAELEMITNLCNIETNWMPHALYPPFEVNCAAGQVRSSGTKKLISAIAGNYFRVWTANLDIGQTYIGRSTVILTSDGSKRPDGKTAGHSNFRRPFDDRQASLAWETASEQAFNKRKVVQRPVLRTIQRASDEFFLNILQEYPSLKNALETTGIARGSLSTAVIGPNHRTGDFYYRYKPLVDTIGEDWVAVKSVKGKLVETGYMVSNLGRLRNTRKVRGGRYVDGYTGTLNKDVGYLSFKFLEQNSKRNFGQYAHIVVCTAFHGQKPGPDYTVDHIDRNRTNNAASNLRWATRAQQRANQMPVHSD
jgi:hypothetical protein